MTGAFVAAFLCLQAAASDGDTLICQDGTRVRLWGVSAPEKREPGGPEATRALSALVNGKALVCLPMGTSFNRIVATCHQLGSDVAEDMVRMGAAKDDPRHSGGYYAAPKP
jgi:micrococcal nuclease